MMGHVLVRTEQGNFMPAWCTCWILTVKRGSDGINYPKVACDKTEYADLIWFIGRQKFGLKRKGHLLIGSAAYWTACLVWRSIFFGDNICDVKGGLDIGQTVL